MEASSYKSFTTSRGLKYSYYFSKPQDAAKPYILFLHGFPSASRDWQHQVPYFESKGFGVIVPDLLGYGGTDKPDDYKAYRQSLMSKDIVELVDSEGAERVIAIGHDWGSNLTSRIAARYQHRFLAFAHLAVGYSPPAPDFEYEKVVKLSRELFQSDFIGYWKFFNEEDGPQIVVDHFDSFYSILFCEDPSLWEKHISPTGALRQWLLDDRTTPTAKYVNEEDKKQRKIEYTESKMAGMNWYRPSMRGLAAQDDADIPEENYTITKPVFFGAALRDHLARPAIVLKRMQPHCPNLTVREFDTDHWVMLAAPGEVNEELWKWIEGVVLGGGGEKAEVGEVKL